MPRSDPDAERVDRPRRHASSSSSRRPKRRLLRPAGSFFVDPVCPRPGLSIFSPGTRPTTPGRIRQAGAKIIADIRPRPPEHRSMVPEPKIRAERDGQANVHSTATSCRSAPSAGDHLAWLAFRDRVFPSAGPPRPGPSVAAGALAALAAFFAAGSSSSIRDPRSQRSLIILTCSCRVARPMKNSPPLHRGPPFILAGRHGRPCPSSGTPARRPVN
jgi:hypothetical protein